MASLEDRIDQLNDAMGALATAMTALTTSQAAVVSGAAEAKTTASSTSAESKDSLALLIADKLSAEPKQYNGQLVRDFDFDYMDPGDPMMGGAVFDLPAEPYHPPKHDAIIKNESRVHKKIEFTRVDPRKGSRSHFDDWFFSQVGSPFKDAVRKCPSYEDYVRGTDMFYTGMLVWYSRLAPGGRLAHVYLDDSSVHTIWNH